jgi:hypothetical protein
MICFIPPSPSPLPYAVRKLSLFLSLPVCCRSSLQTGEVGEGVRLEPIHTTARKPGLLKTIQYSLIPPPPLHHTTRRVRHCPALKGPPPSHFLCVYCVWDNAGPVGGGGGGGGLGQPAALLCNC